MNEIAKTEVHVKCPHCGNKFSPEAALEHDLRHDLEKEYAKRLEEKVQLTEKQILQREQEKYNTRLRAIEADRDTKSKRLLALEEKAVAFVEQERKLKAREEQVELELRKRLLEREKLLKEHAERTALEKANLLFAEKQQALAREKELMEIALAKRINDETQRAREEERMRAADLQKKLDDQTRLVNEMKRKSEQGSMQTQGEVQELAIEDYLNATFVRDAIEEVSKGKRGGDCVHVVRDAYGNTCGKILYESKRTKAFGADWAAKLKDDMRLTQADMGVIVTEVLPADMKRFGQWEGIWVCTFAEFKALSAVFRESLLRIGEVRTAQENKGEKMHMLYQYLTSVEFRQKLEAIVEAFQQMQDDLSKEKAQTMSNWSKREKQIFKVMENTVSLYGDVRGIAGTAVKEIDALEVEEVRVLIAR